MNLFGNPSLPPQRKLVRRLLKASAASAAPVGPRPEGKVIFYDTKARAAVASVAHVTPAAPEIINPKPKKAAAAKRYEMLFDELLAWKKRVNSRLNKLSQEQTVKDVLREMVLPVLREIRTSQTPGPATASAAALPTSPTLEVITHFQSKVFNVPDKMSKVVRYVEGRSKLSLYEPWTENDSGVWMRTKDGGWFQLWDRATNSYHCT
jgi:hypothetical protein